MSDFDFSDSPTKPSRRRPGPYASDRSPFGMGFGIGCGIIAAVVVVNVAIVAALVFFGVLFRANH